jgi:diguanylate cyclase (GGDEF)-like protein
LRPVWGFPYLGIVETEIVTDDPKEEKHPFEDTEKLAETAVHPISPAAKKGESARAHAFLLIIQGPEVGKLIEIQSGVTFIGRAPTSKIRIDDEGVSRNHAKLIALEEGVVEIVDLGSTNGTLANGEFVTKKILRDGDRLQIGRSTILKFSYQDSVEEQFQRQLYESATRDPLTLLHNKRYFDERVQGEIAYAARHDQPISLLLIDVDHFKEINDTLGHQAGDAALRDVATLMSRTVREEDLLARLGGDEFVVVARGLDAAQTITIAERIRCLVTGYHFEFEAHVVPLTVSIGTATASGDACSSIDALVQAADAALYEAKSAGRDCVRAAKSAPST